MIFYNTYLDLHKCVTILLFIIASYITPLFSRFNFFPTEVQSFSSSAKVSNELPFFEQILVSPLILNKRSRTLGSLFFFSTLKTLLHCLLCANITTEKATTV